MRVAVLSDIHSNAAALETVLESVAPFDRLWVTGDIVGYGPNPDAVVERLREEDAIAVQGNHDAAVLGRIPLAAFNDSARRAVEWTATTISEATRAWLAAQPERRVEGEFTLVHGSPRDPLWEYLFSAGAAKRSMTAYDTSYCLVGHTHFQLVFREENGRIEAQAARDGERLMLDERRAMLNPGSVGQPRDGDPRACVMLLDTESMEVEWRRIEYPLQDTQAALRKLPLPSGLADRLAVGL